MKRSLQLTFVDETEWATVLEALRRLGQGNANGDKCIVNAARIAKLCREYLDRPARESLADQVKQHLDGRLDRPAEPAKA